LLTFAALFVLGTVLSYTNLCYVICCTNYISICNTNFAIGDSGEAQECSSNEENSHNPTFGSMLRYVSVLYTCKHIHIV
jgi:hypothetical protein